jgi:tetratricopeptide (TPR) repeat protein
MTEIGPTHPEVGDCYSLLARTYYVAKQYDDAKEALRKAYDLIPPNGSKDHLDLLILTGDLYAASGNFEAAENAYSEVLALPEAADVQVSEMFARSHFQRAKSRERLRRNGLAIRDYQCAAIWLRLEEYENSARARWREIYLSEPEQRGVIDEIAKEDSFLVRVTAYQLYLDRFSAPKAIARRKQPSSQQIAQLMKDARIQTAIRYPHR